MSTATAQPATCADNTACSGVQTIRRVYISGPITHDDPDVVMQNLQAFYAAEDVIRAAQLEPCNPARNGLPIDAPWAQHMRADVKLLMDCDALVLLPGWDLSRGARVEFQLAYALDIPVCTLGEFDGGTGLAAGVWVRH